MDHHGLQPRDDDGAGLAMAMEPSLRAQRGNPPYVSRPASPKVGAQSGRLRMHPFDLGEIACGNLASRARILALLHALPALPVATDKEVLFFIDRHELMGRGIGYVDAHLLAAARMADVPIWTKDKRLHALAVDLELAYVASRH